MNAHRERLLVIDDDPGLSEVIELLLEREGYAVHRTSTVKRGVELAATGEFELVVTDLRLPDGTGLEAIGAIRAGRPELPIIMITSYSSMESAIAALRAGAVDYIIKPFDNEEFLRAIRRALDEPRARRASTARATAALPEDGRPLAIEEYIREVIERFQDSHSETELARMLGIGRKALWMRRRQWGLKRTRRNVAR
jgi:DNA-binding NtrC family response regulator